MFNLNDHMWLVATMLGRAVLRYYLCLNQSLSFFFLIYFISWRLITLQYWNGFCHTLTWISHGLTRIPHPDAPSHLPLHPWINLFQICGAAKNNEETNLMAVGVYTSSNHESVDFCFLAEWGEGAGNFSATNPILYF